MKVPDHPQYVQNETITLNDTVYPILKVEVLPGKLSEASLLNFNWTFVEFTTTMLTLKLDFQNKTHVSKHCTAFDKI